MALLQREVELIEIVQLVGPDALAEIERAQLAIARMVREDFLQQSAFHKVDSHCPIEKAYWMLKAIMDFYQHTKVALDSNIPLEQITTLAVVADMARMKELKVGDAEESIKALIDRIHFSFAEKGVSLYVEDGS